MILVPFRRPSLRRTLRLAGALALAAWIVPDARAQDDDLPDGEPPPETAPAEVGSFDFDLNSVLVATFEADQAFLESEADRVRKLVEQALGQAYVVVRMAEVPPFTDYSADIYLRSCPAGQYIGCVFVVGGRAQTDWTIGGRVSAVQGGYQVDLSFIDVDEAKLVLEFDVVLDGANDGEFKEGVLRIMDALVNGEVSELDVRRDPEAERAAAAEAERRKQLATEFSEGNQYEDPDDFRRGTVGLDAYVEGEDELDGEDAPRSSGTAGGKVTMADLQEMAERGGLPPWEKAGLKMGQYRLYRNSGKKLRDFKAQLQGRKGEVLIKASLNVGQGPWGQVHDSWFVVDADANENAITRDDILAEYDAQYPRGALGIGGQLELGYGLTPWLELTAHVGIRSAPYDVRIFKIRELTDPDVPAFEERRGTPWFAGLRFGFVPMPAYPARPTLHIGASYVAGNAARGIVETPEYLTAAYAPPLGLIVGHVSPGLDISAGKFVSIWARADVDILITQLNAVSCVLAKSEGNSCLANVPEDVAGLFPAQPPGPAAVSRIGIGGSIGATFRFRVAGMR